MSEFENSGDQSADSGESEGLFKELIYLVVWVAAAVIILRSFVFEPYQIPSQSMVPTLEEGDYIFVTKYSYGYGPKSFMFDLPLVPSGRFLGKMPERGDIVVFRTTDTRDPSRVVIKRVVGLPGDRVETIEGVLYVNGLPSVQDESTREVAVSNSEERLRMPGACPPAQNRDFSITTACTFVQETLPSIDGSEPVTFSTTNLGNRTTDNFPAMDTDGNTFTANQPSIVQPDHLFLMGDNRDNSGDSRTSQLGQVPMENVIGQANFTLISLNLPLWRGEPGEGSMLQLWKLFRWDRFFRPLI